MAESPGDTHRLPTSTAKRRGVGGRRSYGDRKLLPARVPTELAEIIEQAARKSGTDTAKYLWMVLAAAHDYPYLGPPPNESQEALPIGA